MESRIAQALNLKYDPVPILWSDEKPAEAQQFGKGKWGCVMAAFGVTAERGLGKDLMTVAVPYKMYLEMEGHVQDSFLQKDTW